MVARIFLHNYKGFVNFEAKFRRIAFLMGPNGSGKTSLIEALHGLAKVIRGGPIGELFEAGTRFRYGGFSNQRFELEVELEDGVFQYTLELGFEGRDLRPSVLREELTRNGATLFLLRDGVLELRNGMGDLTGTLDYDRHMGGLAIVPNAASNRRRSSVRIAEPNSSPGCAA